MTKLNNIKSIQQGLRHSKMTNRDIQRNTRQLASGSRITQAADDAAGLSIATKLNATNRSKQQANRNANDAVSVLQVMDGALSEMSQMVIRLRELSIAAASDTYGDNERNMMQKESSQLIQEIKRISKSTNYNGHDVFDGNKESLDIQVDVKAGSNNKVSINLEDMVQTPYALGISDVRVDTKLRAGLSLAKLDHASSEISRSRAKIGSLHSRLETTSKKLQTDVENGKASHSRVKDLDYAMATADNVRNKIKQQAQVSTMSQVKNQGRDLLRLLE